MQRLEGSKLAAQSWIVRVWCQLPLKCLNEHVDISLNGFNFLVRRLRRRILLWLRCWLLHAIRMLLMCLRRWMVLTIVLRRCRCGPICTLRLSVWRSLTLQSGSLRFEERILNRPHSIGRKYRPRIYRSRHALFPRLQHAFHVSPSITVNEGVGIHEYAVEIAAKVDCVRRANVLDYAIEHEEGREFSAW